MMMRWRGTVRPVPEHEVEDQLAQAWDEPRPRDAADLAIPALRTLVGTGRTQEAFEIAIRLAELLREDVNLPRRAVGLLQVAVELPDAFDPRPGSPTYDMYSDAMQLLIEYGYGYKRDRWLAWWVTQIAKSSRSQALELAATIRFSRFRRRALRTIGEAVPDTAYGAPPGAMLPPYESQRAASTTGAEDVSHTAGRA